MALTDRFYIFKLLFTQFDNLLHRLKQTFAQNFSLCLIDIRIGRTAASGASIAESSQISVGGVLSVVWLEISLLSDSLCDLPSLHSAAVGVQTHRRPVASFQQNLGVDPTVPIHLGTIPSRKRYRYRVVGSRVQAYIYLQIYISHHSKV